MIFYWVARLSILIPLEILHESKPPVPSLQQDQPERVSKILHMMSSLERTNSESIEGIRSTNATLRTDLDHLRELSLQVREARNSLEKK